MLVFKITKNPLQGGDRQQNSNDPVSGILCRWLMLPGHRFLSFIWDCRHRQPLTAHPRVSDEQPFPTNRDPVYLAFQPIRFTIMPVARTCRELLPRVFTLVPMKHRDGIFSVALSVSTVFSRRTFPLGSMALCVVPTFLISLRLTRQNGSLLLQKYELSGD